MKGAGVTLAYIFPGLPYWVGVALVGVVITLNVTLGGMKGITLIQALQYWVKMFAISVPVFVLMAVYGSYNSHLASNKTAFESPPTLSQTASGTTSREIKREVLPAKAPKDEAWISPFGSLTNKPATAAGLTGADAKPYSLLYTYSLIIALVCGTAGLPHILVRFYTNPDGVAAKKTTMWVMILIGVFYIFPPVFGVLGRNLFPVLYDGAGVRGTDKVVLELPKLLNAKHPMLGSILSGITCAGAFAAFMSTFSGLLVSMTGALAHDIYGRIIRPNSTAAQQMKMFKIFAVICGIAAVLLGLTVEEFEITKLVGWAFAVAATSYFPLLFIATW